MSGRHTLSMCDKQEQILDFSRAHRPTHSYSPGILPVYCLLLSRTQPQELHHHRHFLFVQTASKRRPSLLVPPFRPDGLQWRSLHYCHLPLSKQPPMRPSLLQPSPVHLNRLQRSHLCSCPLLFAQMASNEAPTTAAVSCSSKQPPTRPSPLPPSLSCTDSLKRGLCLCHLLFSQAASNEALLPPPPPPARPSGLQRGLSHHYMMHASPFCISDRPYPSK